MRDSAYLDILMDVSYILPLPEHHEGMRSEHLATLNTILEIWPEIEQDEWLQS
jgi:hypothetical protein